MILGTGTSKVYAQTIQTNVSFFSTGEQLSMTPDLGSLLYDLQPTVFINEDNIFLYGGNFTTVECHPSQITKLYEVNDHFSTVQVIKIKIASPEQLNQVTIDLARLQMFENLQYIQIVYMYDICGGGLKNCLLEKTQSMILGEKPVVILYDLAIGD